MVSVYSGSDAPTYLDRAGQELLAEARATWARLGLPDTSVVAWGTDTFVLPWVGDAILGTLAVALGLAGADADIEGAGLVLPGTTSDQAFAAFAALDAQVPPDAVELARRVENREIDKWDWVLDDDLSASAYAARRLDVLGAQNVVARVVASRPRSGVAAPSTPDPPAPPIVVTRLDLLAESTEPENSTTPRSPVPPPLPTPPDPSSIAQLATGSFAAIDFETARPERASACAVSVALVNDGRLGESKTWLIQPVGNEYGSFNTMVHGLGPDDTADAPAFGDVWPLVLDFLADRLVVAHYAPFDLGVLRGELARSQLEWPHLTVACSMVLARRTWPGLASYSLPLLADFLDMPPFRHHDPSQDAIAAAEVVRRVLAATGAPDLTTLAESLHVRFGQLSPGSYDPCVSRTAQADWDLVPPDPSDLNPEKPFFGAGVAFTGTLMSMARREAAQLVVTAGGRFSKSMTKTTDFLVFGIQDFSKFADGERSTKTRKAEELIAKGSPLKIISEDDFLRMAYV